MLSFRKRPLMIAAVFTARFFNRFKPYKKIQRVVIVMLITKNMLNAWRPELSGEAFGLLTFKHHTRDTGRLRKSFCFY